MKTLRLLSFLFLFSPLFSATSERTVALTIYGSVAHPGTYNCTVADASLSTLLERAGGIRNGGGETLRVYWGQAGEKRCFTVKGRAFYASDTDYQLPADAQIFVPECEGLGLSNLSDQQYTQLQKLRADYLARLAQHKIKLVSLETPRPST